MVLTFNLDVELYKKIKISLPASDSTIMTDPKAVAVAESWRTFKGRDYKSFDRLFESGVNQFFEGITKRRRAKIQGQLTHHDLPEIVG